MYKTEYIAEVNLKGHVSEKSPVPIDTWKTTDMLSIVKDVFFKSFSSVVKLLITLVCCNRDHNDNSLEKSLQAFKAIDMTSSSWIAWC